MNLKYYLVILILLEYTFVNKVFSDNDDGKEHAKNVQYDLNKETCTRDSCIQENMNLKQDFEEDGTSELHKTRSKDSAPGDLNKTYLKGNDNNVDENSETEQGISEKDKDTINTEEVTNGDPHTDEDDAEVNEEPRFSNFEYPPLTRLDPGKVGDVVDVELEEGKIYKRITRSVHPPVFEIPDYLSDKECNTIINSALDNGLERSGVVGMEIEDERTDSGDLSEVSRVSKQTWLGPQTINSDLWDSLVKRLSNLIQLPEEQISISEEMQVVSYARGGHYHAHLDSTDTADRSDVPCCVQTPECLNLSPTTEEFEDCCRICRYITVLYYLNDVEKGGETVFPLADMSDELVEEKMTDRELQSWHDLSHFCYNSSLIVTPKRGTAIMWYNHLQDENGYLGPVDYRSHHGGCDIIRGYKWIANNWITATTHRDRKKPTVIV